MLTVVAIGIATLPATAAAVALPDGRAYEQVTPVDKGSNDAVTSENTFGTPTQASRAGDAIVYPGNAAFPGAPSASLTQYRSTRTAAGWTTQGITPPQAPHWSFDLSFHQWFSPDLKREALVTGDLSLPPAATGGYNQLYLRAFEGDTYNLLTTTAPPNVAPAFGYTYFPSFAGASTDLTHAIFEAPDALTPGAPPSATSLYEVVNGGLRLVGILPDKTPDPAGSIAGGGASAGRDVRHAISADGRRIFWTSATDGQLYVRQDGTSTTAVSASKATVLDINGSKPATFWCGTADGSAAFFTSASELTDDANTGDDGGGNQTDAGNDLYRYDVDDNRLTDLTVATDPADAAAGAAVQGVVGCADDGSRIYVVATGALAPGAQSGSPNLYVISADGTTRLIGVLDFADTATWSAQPVGRTAAVTDDGRHLAFVSAARLTGYDNTDAATASPDSQVFVYDAPADRLVCASCRPDGSPPTGPSRLSPQASPFHLARGLTEDGSRVFFESDDALVAADTNGRRDVYERAAGAAGPALLSDGRFDGNAAFMDASATGDDAFILTRAPLVAQDRDDNGDVYDARVGGGFPPEPRPTPPCAGDDCQGAPASAPRAPDPPTLFVQAAGDAATPPARAAFSVKALDARARRAFARTGRATLIVTVTRPGVLSAKATMAAAKGGGRVTAARQAVAAHRAGTVRLRLALSSSARRRLARSGRLGLRIAVTYSEARAPRTAALTLHR